MGGSVDRQPDKQKDPPDIRADGAGGIQLTGIFITKGNSIPADRCPTACTSIVTILIFDDAYSRHRRYDHLD